MKDCLFCKMVGGEIKPHIVFEDDDVLAFREIEPKAPSHLLIIPKKHIASLNDVKPEDITIMGKVFHAVKVVAGQEGLAESGYRTVINCNRDAGQSVFHIHVHLLGGRALSWPPG